MYKKDHDLKPDKSAKVSSREQLTPEDYIVLLEKIGYKVEYIKAKSYQCSHVYLVHKSSKTQKRTSSCIVNLEENMDLSLIYLAVLNKNLPECRTYVVKYFLLICIILTGK